jgi:hypothetical protein
VEGLADRDQAKPAGRELKVLVPACRLCDVCDPKAGGVAPARLNHLLLDIDRRDLGE